MKIDHLLGGCVMAASMAFGAAGSANALIYEQVYAGTVAANPAGGGLFGGLSGGEAFTIRFVTDTSLGSGVTDGPNGQTIEGGSMSGTSSPVSAFVTINGHAFSFVDSIVFGRSQTSSAADQADMLNSISYQAHGVGSIDIVALASGSGSPATLGQSYAMSAFDGAPIAILVGALYDQAFFVQMDVASAYGGVVAAVPEPATWALMITGFGLAGATLRRWTGLQPT